MKAVVTVLQWKATVGMVAHNQTAISEPYAPRMLCKMMIDIPSRQSDCNGVFSDGL